MAGTDFVLSDKRLKCYTGDIIEGCEEWYWHFSTPDIKEFIRLLKKICCSVCEKEIDKLSGMGGGA